ncbi:unnamed protein product [Choristocarpus tenellus]
MATSVADASVISMPNVVKQGTFVTLAYVELFFIFIVGQSIAKAQLQSFYRSKGEKMLRYYNSKDKKMVGWDRVVGNMCEQSMPFLTLFWINIALEYLTLESAGSAVTAGWCYVAFRAIYPVLWFSGGGGLGGPRSKIVFCTLPMYSIIAFLAYKAFSSVHL